MRSFLPALRGALGIGLLVGTVTGHAQTNPTARSIPFTEAFPAGTFSAYPSGFQGWSGVSGAATTTQALAEASAPSANQALSAAAAASGGTAGLYGNLRSAGNGYVIVNTSSNATIGACQLMMAINATNRMNVTVGYGVYSAFANPRTVGVVCQYRVGTSGVWTSISPDSGSNPYSQAGGTTGLKTTVSATLPAACNYQAVVQIRWAVWRGTETGNSSALGFDDVTVGGTLDTDHDGDPDSTDPCPFVANVAPGQGCDDGNANTGNDVITAGCVCVGTVGNDECGSATSLGGAQPFGSCSSTAGNTSGANPTAIVTCGGTTAKDVWYQFYTSYTSHAFIDLVAGTASGLGIEVFGSDCAGSVVYCASGLNHVVPVTAGQWHYVRVFSAVPGTFSICVSEPPSNDDCAYAAGISLNLYGDCPANATSGTTLGATLTSPTPGCDNSAVDVWYSLYGDVGGAATIQLTPGTATGMGIQVRDGCPGNPVYCGTGNTHSFAVPYGSTYYVRVFSATPGTFTICASAAPTNNLCEYATGLGLYNYGDCPTNTVAGTTIGATGTSGSSCISGSPADVWYNFSIPWYATQYSHVFLDLTAGSASGYGIEVRSTDCAGAVVYCATGLHHEIPVTVPAWPGSTTYSVRVTTSTPGTFSICSTYGSPHDECASAESLTLASLADCPNYALSNTTAAATASGGASCASSAVRDVWYTFGLAWNSPYTTHANLDLTPGTASGLGVEVRMGSCTGAVVYCAAGTHHEIPVTMPDYPQYNSYYVRVFSTTPGTFTICASSNPPNDDCAYAPYLTVNTQGGCPGGATVGTTTNANVSGGNTCAPGTSDVWYVLPSGTATSVHIELTANGAAGLGIQVLNACGGTVLYCASGLSHDLSTTLYTNYWVRVFSSTEGGFSICATQTGGAIDCNGVPGGPDQPGTACDDNNAATPYSYWQSNCTCLGYDCQGQPNGTALPGTACSDGNPCTINDTWATNCACTGTALPDGDGDGICDAEDDCPGLYGEIGWSCDDGNPLTPNSSLDANCACIGHDCANVPGGPNMPGTPCAYPYAAQGNTGVWNTGCGCEWTDCNGVANGGAYLDQCGVCVGGNTGLSPTTACLDCAGVPFGPSILDGCGTCRLPGDPNFQHTYQTMAFSGNPGFITGLVQPTTGSPTTTYTAQVLYTNSANTLPSYGYPRLILDFEGNGNFNNTNDRAAVMTPVDVNDLNTADGKLYTTTITGLAVGTSWQARIQSFAGICVQDFGPYDQPDVLVAPDLQIFANDITFSALNPAVNSPLTVKAAVHNVSDYPIVNPVVHLVNQFAPGSVYGDVTLPTLPPHSTDTAVWAIITPGQAAWCPMQVVVDPSNAIAESNELNNTAVRPFINGPYNLPGGIHVYAQASPAVACVIIPAPEPPPTVYIYGYAYYYGTAIPLQDSSVAGATITLVLPQGGTVSGHTDENGFFGIPIPDVNTEGTFTVTGDVTDYTLVGDVQVSYTRNLCQNPCGPDLQALVEIDMGTAPFVAGEAVSGWLTVRNAGCEATTIPTALHVSQNGGSPLIPDAVVPPLAPGATHVVPFSGVVFAEAGIYNICGTADGADEVAEDDENNTFCAPLTVFPALPDLMPFGVPDGGGFDCGTIIQPEFQVSNYGYAPAGAFDVRVRVLLDDVLVHTHVHTAPGLAVGDILSFSLPYQLSALGTYAFEMDIDIPLPAGVVTEANELNNTLTFQREVNPCGRDIHPMSEPPLQAALCQVTTGPVYQIGNGGLLPTGPFDVHVAVSLNSAPVASYTLPIAGIDPLGVAPLTVPFTYSAVGTYTFEVSCDVPLPNGVVVETDEANNTTTYTTVITECLPELTTSLLGCNDHTVAPTDPQYPGTVTYTGILSNSGELAAVNPVMRFAADPGAFNDVTYNGTLAPGQSTTLSVTVPSVAPATADLVLTADPGMLITEHYEDNNSASGELCWEFAPVPLAWPCGWNFWDIGYGRNQPIPMYVGVSVAHLYWASSLNVRFTVSGPGVPGTLVLGDAILNDVHQLCDCPYIAALPNSFVPPLGGTYHFEMIVDPDGAYTECNESDNVLTADVSVIDQPDMRVLSQFINPSLLNPEVDEPITFDLSYENIGTGNLSDQMDMRVLIDEQEVANIADLPGLLSGTNNTVAMPGSYASDVVGIHIMRIIIDAGEEIDESNELNNEATRAFIVGESSNLYFASFTASDASPALGSTVTLNAVVANNGDLPNNGQVWFYRVNGPDTTFLSAANIDVAAGATVALQTSWVVSGLPSTILARIQQVEFLEFNDADNEASVHLGAFDVATTSSPGCTGVSLGSLTASASGGTAPYTYLWSNGSFGATMQAAAGLYSVTVTDAQGQIALASGTIESDPNCTTAPVLLSVRTALEGPYNSTTGLMNDALRLLPTFPHTDPYPALGYTHVGPGNLGTVPGSVTSTTGNNAIVDWVLVELRSTATPSTRLATRSALLQRDGDVVSLDGVSPVGFAVPAGSYQVAVRHRNHLGCMTLNPVALSTVPATVDLRNPATATYGTAARKTSGGAVPIQLLWAGDVTFNHQIKYTGPSNDRDPILVTVGSTTPNNILSNTYSTRDVNLNGNVQYTGSGNDRDPILVNVGSTTPNNLRVEQVP